MIRMTFVEGAIAKRSPENLRFVRISQDGTSIYRGVEEPDTHCQQNTRSGWNIGHLFCLRRRRRCRSNREYAMVTREHWTRSIVMRDRSSQEQNESNHEELMSVFIARLSQIFEVSLRQMNETVDHILTSHGEVFIEFDLGKMVRITAQNPRNIQDLIASMFWRPTLSKRLSSEYEYVYDVENAWFNAVDRGHVVPYYPMELPNSSGKNHGKPSGELIQWCVHDIESYVGRMMSWYLDTYFYSSSDSCDFIQGYGMYMRNHQAERIDNPRIYVVDDNPLELDMHFAHVTSSNLQSHYKYIREYMQNAGFNVNPVIRIKHSLPFILRSLNPVTRKHVFHIVYKDSATARPREKNVFKGLVMLRDILLKMSLKKISMPTIGCSCEFLDPCRSINMIKYIFRKTDIVVVIGGNSMRCWKSYNSTLNCRDGSADVDKFPYEKSDGESQRDPKDPKPSTSGLKKNIEVGAVVEKVPTDDTDDDSEDEENSDDPVFLKMTSKSVRQYSAPENQPNISHPDDTD